MYTLVFSTKFEQFTMKMSNLGQRRLLIATAGLLMILSTLATPAIRAQTPTSPTVVTRIPGVGTDPLGIAVDPITARVYVATFEGRHLFVIDETTNNVIATVPLPAGSGVGVAVNARTDMIYVTQLSGAVAVINGNGNSVVTDIAVPCPKGVDVNPLTNRIYVASECDFRVYVIDGSTNSIIDIVNVQPGPITQTPIQAPESIAVNPATNTIYATESSQFVMAVIDGATDTVRGFIGATGYFCAVGIGMAVSPTTNRVYASEFQNGVLVVDGSTNMAITTIPVGNEPCGVGVDPIFDMVYVANQGDNSVSVVDGSTNGVVATVPNITTGSAQCPPCTLYGPLGLAHDTTTGNIYTSNSCCSQVTVLATAPLPTTTSISCNPGSVAVNQAAQCTATVMDTTSPAGTVSFSSSGSGTFSAASCTLTSTSSSAGSCSVFYTPNPGSEGTHVITGTYNGDSTHSGSSGTFSLTVTKRSTSTSVSCSGNALGSQCTATVSDISPGTPITPTGTVTWSSSSSTGTFNPTSCTLSGSGSKASCTVGYAPSGHQNPVTITATYQGDSNHTGSSGSTTLSTPN
jgi:YVTN family beta-propeller protein